MTHTPGPWTKLVYQQSRSPVVITDMPDGNGLFIAEVPNEADATLIAAAPDLLIACKDYLEQVGWAGVTVSAEDAVRKAIAKASAVPVGKI